MCRIRSFTLILMVLALSILAGCSMQRHDSWVSQYHTDHSLVGSVWDLHTGQPVSEQELADRLPETDFLLIGEVHDNVDHHRLQKDLLDLWLGQGVRPSIIFEQFDRGQQNLLDTHLSDLGRLETETRFTERGWDWDAYLPLIRTARDQQLPVFAGNLSREELKQEHQDQAESAYAELLRPCLLPSAESTLRQDIVDAHCGMIPENMIDTMFAYQRLRDASLAEAMIRAGSPALMIAGNGHVRLDYGAGQILTLTQDKRVLSIALVEVAPEGQSLADYQHLFSDGSPVYDIAIFTPRVRDEDPCETFKEQLQRIKHGNKSAPR